MTLLVVVCCTSRLPDWCFTVALASPSSTLTPNSFLSVLLTTYTCVQVIQTLFTTKVLLICVSLLRLWTRVHSAVFFNRVCDFDLSVNCWLGVSICMGGQPSMAAAPMRDFFVYSAWAGWQTQAAPAHHEIARKPNCARFSAWSAWCDGPAPALGIVRVPLGGALSTHHVAGRVPLVRRVVRHWCMCQFEHTLQCGSFA